MYSEDYIVARSTLLDALDALREHHEALVLVGAHAIYLHTGSSDLVAAEYTTDGDIAVDPRLLGGEPEISSAMRSAHFCPDQRNGETLVGVWAASREIGGVPVKVTVDLLVPESLGGAGRRSARVPPHEKGSLLKVHGLEAAVVDNAVMEIAALDDRDPRKYPLRVAGPTALLISKVIKLSERVSAGALERGRADRVRPKDALDVLRLLRTTPPKRFAEDFDRLIDDQVAGAVTKEALDQLPELFGEQDSPGSLLAAEAAAPEPAEVIALSCALLCRELLGGVRR